MRKTSETTDTYDHTGPSWQDLNRIVGRGVLFAEFTGPGGKKLHLRIDRLSDGHGNRPFLADGKTLRNGQTVGLIGRCPRGLDQPAEYRIIWGRKP